ncbi:hypothetical protein SAMN05421811_103260 [Nonomuraea wenchangensis]|uniref:Uncharacterized protein n=2 Tax=Nonomuraea wenchangensis TaxID=568860 RepID=A0A1I0F1N2_9ACTN|nr:hypothetical protein SAMN05421811_103260 [Nonomuraea wenchangensis]
MADNCWILVNAETGALWDNGDLQPHFRSSDDAAKETEPGWVPRQREQSCLFVECGCPDCTEMFDESGEGYIVHFDNAADASTVTEAEWTKHPDGTYRCVACSPGGDCDCLTAPASHQSGEAS